MRRKACLLFEWRFLPFMLVVFSSGNAVAQSFTDSISQLSEVVVTASRDQHFGNDIKTDVYTRKELGAYAGESLSRFLTGNTALNIKTYGTGGALANISLRGSSTSQVQVNWNGFPINSVTLGSCDFSLIPAGGFDRVSVVYGASGALYGSGTFGGAINLDNNLKPGTTFSGSAQVGYQSLKTINSSFSLNAGNQKAAWQINAWGAHSDNEFTFYDYIQQSKRTQTDGNWRDAGFIQNAVFKLSTSSTLEAGMWYQIKAYDIPSRIGSTSYDFQKDSTLKLFVAYKTQGDHWSLQIKTALFNDKQHYWQKASAESAINSIDSHIAALQGYSNINYRYYLRPYLSVDAGATGTHVSAKVSAYGRTQEEKGLAAFAGLKYDRGPWSLQAMARKEWSNTFNSGALSSLGAVWQVVPDLWVLRVNASQKFRKPTFNDLYWLPGGNPHLKPEAGYSLEAGTSGILYKNDRTKISIDLSLYFSRIKDMIVWRPEGAFWEAKNYQQVRSRGMDAKLLFDTGRQNWQYHSSLTVTLNRAKSLTDADIREKVMTYSPMVITAWEHKFSVGIMDFTLWHHFSADRFYNDNALLDPYQTIDVQAGAKIPVGNGKLGLYASVNNLTGTSYELIRLYPMPGRYWSMKINYTF